MSSSLSASAATISYGDSLDATTTEDGTPFDATYVIGKKAALEQAVPTLVTDDYLGLDVSPPMIQHMLQSISAPTGGSATTLVNNNNNDLIHKFSMAGLPSKLSRNNHPMAVHTLTRLVTNLPAKGRTRLVVLLEEDYKASVAPLASAIAKAFPLFSLKTTTTTTRNNDDDSSDQKTTTNHRAVHVVFCHANGTCVSDAAQLNAARIVTEGVQLAARLVDSHPELLTTTEFAKEAQRLVDASNGKITMTQLVGEELLEYGGLYGVGKGAVEPPRLVILEYDGTSNAGGDSSPTETVALVGKGIVFDTGGLSLKSKTGMCGMKHDMGGAAGLLGGFWAAVQLGVPQKVTLLLCLAENAIGPKAVRNDDILTMYSGKTVEVNNADAEGRLVLGDGVAHATRHIDNLDLVVDMATLTGAQLVATGKKHAGILANKEELETRAVVAGMASGDLCYPLLYAPEFLMDEFKSEVADMKNSVKDRSNAQTSCAGHFIESHLNQEYKGGWLHVDMAGPGTNGQRGTGYGVGLVLSLLNAPGF